MGWLGASPDAKVTDPSFQPPDGIAEFKCPFPNGTNHLRNVVTIHRSIAHGIMDTFDSSTITDTTTRCNSNSLLVQNLAGVTFVCTFPKV